MDISPEEIIRGFVLYNTEVETLDNSVYNIPSVRIAMYMEYLLDNSWHEERQGYGVS